MVAVKVKWNKQVFENVDFDVNSNVLAFKTKIQILTGVPIYRQKLTTKEAWVGILKDDHSDLSKVKEGQLISLIGTADIADKPVEIKFVEDMTVNQLAESGLTPSAGFINKGNTCYMNATLQCLRKMPELRAALKSVTTLVVNGNDELSNNLKLVREFNRALQRVDDSGVAVPPDAFIKTLREHWPEPFAQVASNGITFVQQDAEEFYNLMYRSFEASLGTEGRNLDHLITVELEHTVQCIEAELEPITVTKEKRNKIVCNIVGGGREGVGNTDHLRDGIKINFEGQTVKRSNILQRDALWSNHTKISKLPRYLCIQFMRFFFKKTPDSADHQGVKCKILRSVSFPMKLDINEFCNEEIQNQLNINRLYEFKQKEDEIVAKRTKIEEEIKKANETSNINETVFDSVEAIKSNDMEVEEEDSEELAAAIALSCSSSLSSSSSEPTYFERFDLPPHFTGHYECHSVVTHKGMDADSGHYIGWVRQEPESDLWWRYDDNKVTEVKTEEILTLKGGGQKDMAYLTFYRYLDTNK